MSQLLSILICLTLCLAGTGQLQAADATPTYEDTVAKARKLMDDGKLAEAYLTASAAISMDEKRWEAYALVGLVLNAQGANADAKAYVQKALDRAPADKKTTLQNIETKITHQASIPSPAASGSELTGEARRKLDVLMLIAEDADKAKTTDERQQLLREYLDKSGDFVRTNPDQLNVWLIRAAAALELNEPNIGWGAGKKLKALSADKSNDAKARKVMAMLDRKGWLSESEPAVENNGNSQGISDGLNQAIAAVQDAFRQFGRFQCKTTAADDNGRDIDHLTEYENKVIITYPQITFSSTYKYQNDQYGRTGEGTTSSSCNFADLDSKKTLVRKQDISPSDKNSSCLFYYTEFYSFGQSIKVERDSKSARSESFSEAPTKHTEFMADFVYDIGFPDEKVAQLVSKAVNHLIEVAHAESSITPGILPKRFSDEDAQKTIPPGLAAPTPSGTLANLVEDAQKSIDGGDFAAADQAIMTRQWRLGCMGRCVFITNINSRRDCIAKRRQQALWEETSAVHEELQLFELQQRQKEKINAQRNYMPVKDGFVRQALRDELLHTASSLDRLLHIKCRNYLSDFQSLTYTSWMLQNAVNLLLRVSLYWQMRAYHLLHSWHGSQKALIKIFELLPLDA